MKHEVDGKLSLQPGLNYVRSTKAAMAQQLGGSARAVSPLFTADDLALRVRALTRSDLAQLACIGA